MALHTKPAFAKLCGLTTGNLTNYIKRRKVVLSGDYVDDQIPVNREFLAHRLAFNAGKKEVEKEAEQARVPEGKVLRLMHPDPGVPDPPNIQDPEDEELASGEDSGESMTLLTKKKLKVEITKKHREIALLRLREDKLKAIVIPTDLVKVVFQQHCRSIATEFKNSIDNIITKISKKKDLNVNEQAELRGELLFTINMAVDKSIGESKKSINNIVREFIEKREVGERT